MGVLFVFQNCSAPLPANLSSSAASTSGTAGTPPVVVPPPPSGPTWAKGDAFDYSTIPAIYQSQMVQTQITELNYAAYAGLKAIAITSNGLGFVKLGPAGYTQAEVNKIALDACFTISRGLPCGLLATGNAFESASSALPTMFTQSMNNPTLITDVPFVRPADAAAKIATYNAGLTPKAIAVSLDGTIFSIANEATKPLIDISEAERLVMERCEMGSSRIPCTLFASNSTVVFNGANANRSIVIDYAQTVLGARIPGMRASQFASNIQNVYLPNVNGGQTGAIYITATGTGGDAFGAGAASQALSFCNSNMNDGFACFKYATNKVLEPLLPNLISYKTGMNLHCKVVPRQTCAMHLALGCPAGGKYYTYQSGVIALELCN